MSTAKIASQLCAIVTEASSLLSKKQEATENLLTKMINSNTTKLSSGEITFTIVDSAKKNKLPFNEKNVTLWLKDFENGSAILQHFKLKSQEKPQENPEEALEETDSSPNKKLKITKRKRIN